MRRNFYLWVSVLMMGISGAALFILWLHPPIELVPLSSVSWYLMILTRSLLAAFFILMFGYGLKALLFVHLLVHVRSGQAIRRMGIRLISASTLHKRK